MVSVSSFKSSRTCSLLLLLLLLLLQEQINLASKSWCQVARLDTSFFSAYFFGGILLPLLTGNEGVGRRERKKEREGEGGWHAAHLNAVHPRGHNNNTSVESRCVTRLRCWVQRRRVVLLSDGLTRRLWAATRLVLGGHFSASAAALGRLTSSFRTKEASSSFSIYTEAFQLLGLGG